MRLAIMVITKKNTCTECYYRDNYSPEIPIQLCG